MVWVVHETALFRTTFCPAGRGAAEERYCAPDGNYYHNKSMASP